MHGAVQLWPAMELASTEFYERNLHASFCYGTNTGRLRGQRSLHIGVLDGGRLVESRRTRRGRSAERRQLPAIHGLRREQNREQEAKRGGKSISSFVTSTWGLGYDELRALETRRTATIDAAVADVVCSIGEIPKRAAELDSYN